jgi:general secretion pathway protein F
MPMYAFKGIGATGKAVNGVKDADSPKALRQAMRRDGVVVTEVNLSKGGANKAAAGGGKKGLGREVDLGGLFGGVGKGDLSIFTRQLATLLRSGIPLAESLAALFEQTEHARLKIIVGEVRTAVNEGSSLGDALAKHPRVFDNLYVAMVRAGEVAGNLDQVLTRLSDFLENSQKIKGKVQTAMVYPVLMIGIGAVLMAILMIAVIPNITSMFKQSGKTLPLKTRFLIAFSDFIRDWILLLIPLSIIAIVLFYFWTQSAEGKVLWHRIVLKMPLVGRLVRKLNISRFARTLGTMLQAGVPMLRALDTAREIVGNVVLRKVIDNAKTAVTEGESLAVTLKRSGHFPASVTHMIATGEKSGQLELMLQNIADDNEADVDRELTRMTSMLEPLMLVVMAIGVGFVVFSILEPIMDMSSMSRTH